MKLNELIKTYRLSKAIQGVLVNTPGLPPNGSKGAIDIEAYFWSSTFTEGAANAQGLIGKLLSGPRPPKTLWPTGAAANLERDVSSGLERVFEDAREVRRRTGGKDNYLGARHILFSILTAPDSIIREEADRAFAELAVPDTEIWIRATVSLIASSLERGESATAWTQICEERSVSPAYLMDLRLAGDVRLMRAPPERVRVPIQRDPVPSLVSDEPWAQNLASASGQDHTAAALARLIAAKSLRPPLAIGIFGPWGSGKSFLMRRIHQAIAGLASDKHPSFHERIVQIRFNAWHYLDADLWASLAGHVFEELDTYVRTTTETDPKTQILGRLSTARDLTLETARALIQKRRAAKDAEKAHRDAEAALEQKRADFSTSLGQTLKAGGQGAKALLQVLGQDAKTKSVALDTIQRVYGEPLETLTGRWRSVDDAGKSLKTDASLWLGIVRQFSWKTALAIAAVTVVAFLAPAVLALIPSFKDVFEKVSPILSATVTLAGATAAWASTFSRRAALARDAVLATVRDYRQSVAGDLEAATAQLNGDLARAESALALAEAEAEAERSRQTLAEALRQQADASRDYTGETSAGRLKAFVKARASQDGLYRSRQGLISAVRRDFADLAAMMNPSPEKEEQDRFVQQKTLYDSQLIKLRDESDNLLTKDEWLALDTAAPLKPEENAFSRIVLYIDDLDRCPPAKVVEVLQAVHLLLAYSLFVVVVAVDVRWLTGAICKVYPELTPEDATDKDRQTAALDYLEKIFQVPVWTDPLRDAAAVDFVEQRMKPVTPPILVDAAPPPDDPAPAPAKPPKARARVEASLKVVKIAGANSPPSDLPFEPLRIPEAERKWLESLAQLTASSPRRLLRLVNTYCLARAGIAPDEADALLADGYRPFAALLALAAAAPAEFDDLVDDVGKAKTMAELKTLWAKRGDPALIARNGKLLARLEAENIGLDPGLQEHVDRASRYSFTGGGRSPSFTARTP